MTPRKTIHLKTSKAKVKTIDVRRRHVVITIELDEQVSRRLAHQLSRFEPGAKYPR